MSKKTPQNLPPSSKGQKEVWSLERLVQQAAVSKNSEMVRSVQCPCGLRFSKSILEIKDCDQKQLAVRYGANETGQRQQWLHSIVFSLSLWEGWSWGQTKSLLTFLLPSHKPQGLCVFSLLQWMSLVPSIVLHHPGDAIFLKDKGHLTRPWIKIPSWSWNPKHPEHICWGVWSLSLLTHWII